MTNSILLISTLVKGLRHVGMHQTVGALDSTSYANAPKFAAHSNPLPLSLRESVELDGLLLVLAALFVLVPFCLLSGES